ncbi:MAG: hypothetical protein KIT80_22650 [Chitinophagaceae bacterium]|nr:hypothetical protein [Chitinophagaceae bacterium]MCW5929737.1 hypothetical protein [Chitinophagaceae bacterium]
MHEPQPPEVTDVKKTKNVLLFATCLIIIGEVVALLANSNFSWMVTLVTLVEVVIFLVLSFIAVKNPYSAVFSALAVFIIASILAAAVKPTYLGGSIIIKIFILIYLVRAIPEARQTQLSLRKEKE